jgi:hypothetical protein
MLLLSTKEISLLISERVKMFLQLMHQHRNDASTPASPHKNPRLSSPHECRTAVTNLALISMFGSRL